MGECAGEVVARRLRLHRRETEAFEAQLLLDDGKFHEADNRRVRRRCCGPRNTSVRLEWLDAPTDPKTGRSRSSASVSSDTKVFWHRQHANQFSNYLLNRHENRP
jgi:hypothetical protein